MSECPKIGAYQAHLIVDIYDSQALNAAATEVISCLPRTPRDAAIDLARDQAEAVLQATKDASQNTFYGLQEAIKQLAKMPGKRILLVASDGFLAARIERAQDSIVNQALRAGVVVNGLDTKGLLTASPSATDADLLARRVPPATFKWKTDMLLSEVIGMDQSMSDLRRAPAGK